MTSSRISALTGALSVTFLWSTSYVLIKLGLKEINPLAFAAYRYTLASIILALFVVCRRSKLNVIHDLRRFLSFSLLGFTGYFVAQGLQFVGLYYLQAIAVTFVLNLTPILVLVLSFLSLKEKPSSIQLMGIVITLFGVLVFFANDVILIGEAVGLAATLVSGIGWATYMVLTRYYLRGNGESITALTTCSMALGSLMLLMTTILTGNIVVISIDGWITILWLSAVNTAFAFLLWNRALRTLRAYEQSILQNTMLIQVTLLASFLLGEALTTPKVSGIIMVFIGVLMVQLRSRAM